MQVEPFMPDRPTERGQAMRDTEVYAVRARSSSASGTRLLVRLDCDVVAPEEDPTSFNKANLGSAEWERYRDNCLPGPREPFKRDTV